LSYKQATLNRGARSFPQFTER